MSDKLSKKPITITKHDTGVNVTRGNVSVHLGKNGVIDVEAGGKTVYTGTDAKQAGEDTLSSFRIDDLYDE